MQFSYFFQITFSEKLDDALWRRLKCRIHVPIPGEEERLALLTYYLGSFNNITKDQLLDLAKNSEGLSSADISSAAENILNKWYLKHYDDQFKKIDPNLELQPATYEEVLNIICHTTATNTPPKVRKMKDFSDKNKNGILDVIEAIETEDKQIVKRSPFLEFCTCS